MPSITVEIKWDTPDEPFWLNADNVAIALHAYCKNTKFVVHEPSNLSASEALFGFAGWLTTCPKQTIMSSTEDSGVIAGLIAEFCKANQLIEPREGWSNRLVHPG